MGLFQNRRNDFLTALLHYKALFIIWQRFQIGAPLLQQKHKRSNYQPFHLSLKCKPQFNATRENNWSCIRNGKSMQSW